MALDRAADIPEPDLHCPSHYEHIDCMSHEPQQTLPVCMAGSLTFMNMMLILYSICVDHDQSIV